MENKEIWIPIIVVGGILVLLLIIAGIIAGTKKVSFAKTFANLVWMVFIGWELALSYFIMGAICCVTILLIPAGLQFFKFARLAIWPFGYRPDFTKLNGFKLFVNIVWLILFGWELSVPMFVAGAICCATVILIPCGLQLFKFGRLTIMPLGTTIEKITEE